MKPEEKQNFEERLRLIQGEVLATLDAEIARMLGNHARDGLVASGRTIGMAIRFISVANSAFYNQALSHMRTLNLKYHSSLESNIQELTESTHQSLQLELMLRFSKTTTTARSPQLYERMTPDIESSMSNDLATFQNSLNSIILNLKTESHTSFIEKTLWGTEAVISLLSMFVAGMWYNEPTGNYEPVLIALGITASLVGITLKRYSKT